jgi:3-dehydroquinate synthase
MIELKVEIPHKDACSYPIYIGEGILAQAGGLIRQCTKATKILIVSNERVFALYGEKFRGALESEGFRTETLLIEEGEEYKNIVSLEKIWEKAIEARLERKDAITALGGGVIGDVTGFAAATYLRGIDFIQVPTTLLAQVDSSVGGKVAINSKSGKNLLGNFYQPKIVLSDTSVLSSLPDSEIKVGLAEVIKYGFIEKTCGLNPCENSFLSYLKENRDDVLQRKPNVMEYIIRHSCALKAAVVNQDEREAGLRAILNFGHTIGHAVEKCYGYKGINHGEAVAIGMRGAFHIALIKGMIDKEYFDDSLNLLTAYGMDYKIREDATPEALYDAMGADKKVSSGKIKFVLPIAPAEVEIFNNVSEVEVIDALEKLY